MSVSTDFTVSSQDIPVIQHMLDTRVRGLSFPRQLARQFEVDTGTQRNRKLIISCLAGLALLNAFLFQDYMIIPDVFWLAVTLRLGLVTVFGLCVVWMLSKNPAPWLRESMQATAMLLTVGTIDALILLSQEPYRLQYLYGVLLVVMFTVMVQRLRFWFALTACAISLALHIATVLAIDGLAWQQQIGASALMAGGIFLALMAGYSLEQEERVSYLHSLLQRLRNNELEELSNHDALTRLGNRRALDQEFNTLRGLVGANGTVSLIIADIDHFKSYNDSFGHLNGDRCICRIAEILRDTASPHNAKVYRFGGEEFVILVPDIDEMTAARVAEYLRRSVEQLRIPHRTPAARSWVTASFGAASLKLDETTTLDHLIHIADTALYEAKRRGRNQTVPRPLQVVAENLRKAG